jgi:hypothetical protein
MWRGRRQCNRLHVQGARQAMDLRLDRPELRLQGVERYGRHCAERAQVQQVEPIGYLLVADLNTQCCLLLMREKAVLPHLNWA